MDLDDILLPINFLGLPPAASGYDTSRVVVLPVPYEGTVTFRSGTRLGPQAIILASRQTELYRPDSGDEPAVRLGVHTLGELVFHAGGPEPTLQRIAGVADRILNDGKFLVALGGEHSISGPLVEAHLRRRPGLSVLQIDAHLDLRPDYLDSPHSHASVMSRLVEHGVPVQAVGIRNVAAEEAPVLEATGLVPVTAREVAEARDDAWIERALEALTDEVYVSIDLDGFDPSVVRSVGTPEPGGLRWYDVLRLLEALALRKRIVGFDVVELCPQPGDLASDVAAANLTHELICLAHPETRG